MKKTTNNIVTMASVLPIKTGVLKIVDENMPFKYKMASVTDLALKKIHAKTVNPKVITIEKSSLKDGNNFPLATISMLFLWVLNIMDGIIYKALSKPQTIKVQLAPCQKPLTTKMINVLRILIQFLPLLPPKGMYR
jgi:hypothetical protein